MISTRSDQVEMKDVVKAKQSATTTGTASASTRGLGTKILAYVVAPAFVGVIFIGLIVAAIVIAVNSKSKPCPREDPSLLGVSSIEAAFSTASLGPNSASVTDGALKSYTFTASFVTTSDFLIKNIAKVGLLVSPAHYGQHFPNLHQSHTWSVAPSREDDPEGSVRFETTLSGTAPSTVGLFLITMQAGYAVGTVGSKKPCYQIVASTPRPVRLEVTCSILLDDWCNGEYRFIPARGTCERTYKPCGQETAVGVAQTDNCYVYGCNSTSKTCSRFPLGGPGCLACTPVESPYECEPIYPNCLNADSSPRQCGDDGCGTPCGTGCGTGLFCDALGTCSAASLGTCSVPYNLFMDSATAPGPTLNPVDTEGIRVFSVSQSDINDYTLVTSASRNALGFPSDFLTVPDGGVRVRIFVNSAFYFDSQGEPSRDVSFAFSVGSTTAPQGFEAYLLSQDGKVDGRDTTLSLVNSNCTELTNVSPADVLYSDDASPPGGFGSRVLSTGLAAGDYKLVLSTYSQEGEDGPGPMWLEVIFTDASPPGTPCTPVCENHLCGSNGCGGICNVQTCAEGATCNNGVCFDPPCTCEGDVTLSHLIPDNALFGTATSPARSSLPENSFNYTRSCGPDVGGCGGTCGTCPSGYACQLQFGVCLPVPDCDELVPVCAQPVPDPDPSKTYFCAGLCEWVELNEAVSDLIPNAEAEVIPEISIHWRFFNELSCALDEDCVLANGWRLILRFPTSVHNIGTAGFRSTSQYERPDLFVYATCHQHYHYNGFAEYEIYDPISQERFTKTGKRSYCVETTDFFQTGPKTPCESFTSCEDQGLEPGMTDTYAADLDCQWIDITPLHERGATNKWYVYSIEIDTLHNQVDYSFGNNIAKFPIFVPCAPDLNTLIQWDSYVAANPQVCCQRIDVNGQVVGPHPDLCPVPSAGYCDSPPAMPTCSPVSGLSLANAPFGPRHPQDQ